MIAAVKQWLLNFDDVLLFGISCAFQNIRGVGSFLNRFEPVHGDVLHIRPAKRPPAGICFVTHQTSCVYRTVSSRLQVDLLCA